MLNNQKTVHEEVQVSFGEMLAKSRKDVKCDVSLTQNRGGVGRRLEQNCSLPAVALLVRCHMRWLVISSACTCYSGK